MKIFDLLRNPLVKIVGILTILYFALFSNTYNPNSLGNRFSKENLKKNFDAAQEQGKFIATNLKIARDLEEKRNDIASDSTSHDNPVMMVSSEDIKTGKGMATLACGDEITISYRTSINNDHQIDHMDDVKFIVGSRTMPLIEKHIIGMRALGIRNIYIPKTAQITDEKLEEFQRLNGTDLTIQVTLHSFAPKVKTLVCD
jgi:hypothetical protein